MNIKDLMNNEYLTPLLATILQEEKTCLLMGNFNINLLNTDTEANAIFYLRIFLLLTFYSQQGWQKL